MMPMQITSKIMKFEIFENVISPHKNDFNNRCDERVHFGVNLFLNN
jgi:hypothetical protein